MVGIRPVTKRHEQVFRTDPGPPANRRAEDPAPRERATHQHARSSPPCPSNPLLPFCRHLLMDRAQLEERRILRRELLVPLDIGDKPRPRRKGSSIAER